MSTPEELAAEIAAESTQERPEWLPEQFKTPQDLAKSYDESRREMDRLRSQADEDRAQFAAALEQMSQMQEQQPQYQTQGYDPQTNALLAQYTQAVEQGDAAAQLAITLGLQQQVMEQALDSRFKALEPKLGEQAQADRTISFEIAQERVAKLYGDRWAKLAPDVNNWLREHPNWLPTANDPNQFESVIQEAAKYVSDAKTAQQFAQYEADRNAKLASQTATGSGAHHPLVTDEKRAQWEEIKAAGGTSYADIARRSG